MDIPVEDKKTKLTGHWKWLLAFLAVVFVIVWQWSKPASSETLQRKDLILGEVNQGDFTVGIEAYGTLVSNRQKRLTSRTAATVDEIYLKPGAIVEPDSAILQLGNPDLLQDLERVEQDLIQEQANLRMIRLNNSRELMAEEASLAQLKADYETVRFRLNAEERLIESGTISRLTYNTTRLKERQLAERVKILTGQREQLLLVHQEALKIQQEKIKQANGALKSLRNKVEQLTVRAGIQGVLQELPVVLGQSVSAGETLAVAGSTSDLVAKIKVPQTQVEKVTVGLPVQIDNRRETATGKVTRISPKVIEGTVTVEVAFDDLPPTGSRPDQSVSADIIVDTVEDALFIERPVNAVAHSQRELFKLDDSKELANSTVISFGVESGRHIQIVAGASDGEMLILNDVHRSVDSDQVVIVN